MCIRDRSQGEQSQEECQPGGYQPYSGQQNCIDADPGYFVDLVMATTQTPCPSGTYNPNFSAMSQSSCLESEEGYYVATEGSAVQDKCAPGTYQPSPGQSTCLEADPGFFTSSEASSTQEECAPGTYQPSPGQSTCLGADPGFFVSEAGQSQQTPAPFDQFVSSPRSIVAESCPENTITLQESSTSEDECLTDSDGDRLHDEV